MTLLSVLDNYWYGYFNKICRAMFVTYLTEVPLRLSTTIGRSWRWWWPSARIHHQLTTITILVVNETQCTSRRSPGSYAQQWQFPLDTQDIPIRWTLTACSALEADAAMRYRNLRLTLTLTLDVLFFTCQHLESMTLQPSKVDGLVDAVCCLTCRIFGVQ